MPVSKAGWPDCLQSNPAKQTHVHVISNLDAALVQLWMQLRVQLWVQL